MSLRFINKSHTHTLSLSLSLSLSLLIFSFLSAGCGGGSSTSASPEISNNANLKNLNLSAGTLSPSFSENVTSYTVEADYSVLSIILTPIAANENATIEVNGSTVDSGDSSDAIDLSVGANTITVEVTAEDTAITKTYTVVVTRLAELSHNANLSDLILSSGTLSPVFDENTISYTAQVSNAISSITVTPTVAGVNASVKVNNVAVDSGNASQAVNLSMGANTITVKVIAEDTTTTKTYTVIVTRLAAPSSNANLANLTLSSGTLSPSFAENTIAYTSQVSNAVSSITITPAVAGVNATVMVNNVAVVSGTASQSISLSVGANTITTVVTAEDTTTTKTYTVVVARLADLNHNANLASLTLSAGMLSPAFDGNTISYTSQVLNAVSSITFTPTVAGVNATVKVNNVAVVSGTASQSISLSVGANTITTVVTAEETTTTKTYTVVVTRLADLNHNANLANLTLSAGTLSPAFDGNTISYTSQVLNVVSSITVTPTVAGVNATVKVNNVSVISGTASQAINLSVGSNTVTVVVTTEDTTTIKTYTVTVTRNTIYTVTYSGNGSTGGSPPTGPTSYEQGQTVTVLGNTGNLIRTDLIFNSWNTASNTSGTNYNAGDTFSMGTANIILYTNWTFWAFHISDTGQTGSYTTTFGEDSDYVNIPYARSLTGPTQHTTYTGDYTTKDNVTGLIWKTCSEGQTGSACSGTAGTYTWDNALTACTTLNSANSGAGYAGRKDWRLPSIEELNSILDYGKYNPSVDVSYFPGTASIYWSSSIIVYSTGYPRFVSFYYGDTGYNAKAVPYYVRCVAGP